MSDNSTRWQRVATQTGDKPRFQARQSTDDLPASSRRVRRHSDESGERVDRSQRWWTFTVFALVVLAGLLVWLVFFA